MEKKKNTIFSDGVFCGGEGGIRTLERLLTVTRFPIVRARPNYATSPHSCSTNRLYFIPAESVSYCIVAHKKRIVKWENKKTTNFLFSVIFRQKVKILILSAKNLWEIRGNTGKLLLDLFL